MLSQQAHRLSKSVSRQILSKPLRQSISSHKKSCIYLLKNCKSISQIKQIQAQIFQLGLQQNPETLIKLVAFCTDPSHGNLLYSERIFDHSENPCLLMYNLLIKAYAKKGSFQKSILLFHKLRERGVSPDNFTYPFVFKAIGRLGEVKEGEKVVGYVVKTGLEFDTYVCNSIMDMYAVLGRIGDVKKLFDGMPEKDVVSWNVYISGHVKCMRYEDAVDAFRRMQKESNLRPDEGTIVSTLSACTALKKLDLGKEIHRYINDELGFTPIMENAVLDMYCKCGCLSEARKFFDEIPSENVIFLTSMVSGYVNCGQLDEARDLFDRSPVKDVVLWTAMVNGYVQFNQFDEAVAIFREMQIRRLKPDKFIVVALLTGCAQLGALEQGKWIHGFIEENGITVDAVVGTALIEMYAKCGFIEKALEIFYELREKDTASWTSIICGLAMNGKINKSLELFSQMITAGAKPDDITFIGVLSACSHGGLVDEGRRFFNSMSEVHHIEPKLEHYGCLIDLLGRAGLLGEAQELIRTIPNEENDVVSPLYGSLLSACRTYGNVEISEKLAALFEKIEPKDSGFHTLLANIYASANRWDDVTKVRQKMKETGVRKVPGCSSIEVNGIIQEFHVGDPSHLEMKEICSILDRMSKTSLGSEENEMEGDDLTCLSFP